MRACERVCRQKWASKKVKVLASVVRVLLRQWKRHNRKDDEVLDMKLKVLSEQILTGTLRRKRCVSRSAIIFALCRFYLSLQVEVLQFSTFLIVTTFRAIQCTKPFLISTCGDQFTVLNVNLY
jgi:hypothetical protein